MAKSSPVAVAVANQPKKQNVFDIIGGIFKPILIVIVGAGILQALRDVLLQLGAISRVSSSYIFLDALGNAVFYFLPIFLAISCANVFKATPFLAAAVAAFLLYPSVVNLYEWAHSVGWDLTLFGVIPISYAKYTSSVLPIILIVYFQSKVEPIVKKIVPDLLMSILFPVLTLFVTCVVGIIILGPIGTWLGDAMALGITWLNTKIPWLVPTVIGATTPFLVLTGSHYSLFPVATQNLAVLGYDTVMMPGNMAANLALAGVSFAVAIKAKKKSYKSYCASSGITSCFGISQASLYGIAIPLKKPLIAAVIGGGLGGFYAGITSIKAHSFATPGLLALVGYTNESANIINALITVAISFVAAFILTIVMGFEEPDHATVAELTGEKMSEEEQKAALEKVEAVKEEARAAEVSFGEARLEADRARVERSATKLVEGDPESKEEKED